MGQIPQMSAGLRFYDNAGQIKTAQLNNLSISELNIISTSDYSLSTNVINVPTFASVNVILNENLTNRIKEFSISLNINRIPIYNCGNKKPKRVDLIYPIDANVSFTIEVSPLYSGTSFRDFPKNSQVQNVSIQVNDYSGNKNITNYQLNDMNLISENYITNVDGNVTVSKQYNCKITE